MKKIENAFAGKKTRIDVDLNLVDLNEGQLDWLPKNPRQWTKDDLERTVESLKEDPDWMEDKPLQIVPYTTEDGEARFIVFCGNMRTTAGKELSWPTMPAVLYEPASEEDRETVRRRAIKDNGSFGCWDSDILADWPTEPAKLLGWGVPDWVMGGAGTGAESKSNSRAAGEGDTPSEPAGLKLQAEFNSEEELFEAIDWLNLHGGKNVTRV